MKALAIADTHVETIEQLVWLQHVLLPYVSDVDLILHAGDATIPEVTDHLAGLRPTYAVCGDRDFAPLRWSTPHTLVAHVGDFTVGITHGRHGLEELAELMRGPFAGVDAIVYGHSHEPFVGELNEVLLINPGSPTDESASPRNSIAILEADGELTARIVDVIRPVPQN